MIDECAECRQYPDDGLPGEHFPAAWLRLPDAAGDSPNDRRYRCRACGAAWHLRWNPRDGVFDGIRRLPQPRPPAQPPAFTATQAVREGLDPQGLRAAEVRRWFEKSAGPPSQMVQALAEALGGQHGVLDGRTLVRCLGWLESVAARGTRHAGAVAANAELLEMLEELPQRPRAVADRRTVSARQLARGVAAIGRRLATVSPTWYARLCALDAAPAHRTRALRVLEERLAAPDFPPELVLQAIGELSRDGSTEVPYTVADRAALQALLQHEAGSTAARSGDIARELRVLLGLPAVQDAAR